jgi:hypothetical protein
VWPDGKTDHLPVKGLALGVTKKSTFLTPHTPADKLWPLWIWIYCISECSVQGT